MRNYFFFLHRSCFLLLLSTGLFASVSIAQQGGAYPFSANAKRILFLGNSITYAGSYITDIETYFLVHYPEQQVQFINEGLPSETVSGLSEPNHADGKFPRPDLHERLARVLDLTKPAIVVACYGMNDGIYMPFDEERFKAYRDGMHWLHDQLEQSGVKEIIFLTPPVHDDAKLGTLGYNLVLDTYAEWLLAQKDSLHWQVADIHFPMNKYLGEKRVGNPSFKLAEDGVHPGEQGHWLMAKSVLLYLGQQVNDAADIQSAINSNPHASEILALVQQRQMIMKDAWLTASGHKRPGMNKGLPLPEAQAQYDALQLRIAALLK